MVYKRMKYITKTDYKTDYNWDNFLLMFYIIVVVEHKVPSLYIYKLHITFSVVFEVN